MQENLSYINGSQNSTASLVVHHFSAIETSVAARICCGYILPKVKSPCQCKVKDRRAS